jgi:hypothetical protein
MLKPILISLCSFVLLLSCGGKGDYKKKEVQNSNGQTASTTAPSGVQAIHIPESVHGVKCGCAIDGIGKCGEYVDIDGKYLPIDGDLGLGSMPFCHKEGLKAKVEGDVKEGKFHFKTFHLIKQ